MPDGCRLTVRPSTAPTAFCLHCFPRLTVGLHVEALRINRGSNLSKFTLLTSRQ